MLCKTLAWDSGELQPDKGDYANGPINGPTIHSVFHAVKHPRLTQFRHLLNTCPIPGQYSLISTHAVKSCTQSNCAGRIIFWFCNDMFIHPGVIMARRTVGCWQFEHECKYWASADYHPLLWCHCVWSCRAPWLFLCFSPTLFLLVPPSPQWKWPDPAEPSFLSTTFLLLLILNFCCPSLLATVIFITALPHIYQKCG